MIEPQHITKDSVSWDLVARDLVTRATVTVYYKATDNIIFNRIAYTLI
jgi:hypothetical protein